MKYETAYRLRSVVSLRNTQNVVVPTDRDLSALCPRYPGGTEEFLQDIIGTHGYSSRRDHIILSAGPYESWPIRLAIGTRRGLV